MAKTRIILFAGKGGVGKTSISTATGLATSKKGFKTLIMSLDPAHSLSDSFDLDVDLLDRHRGVSLKVDENLWIQELDIQYEIERNWKAIYGYLSGLLNMSGLEDVVAEELAIIPGMEELSCLLYINQYVKKGKFDTIILDCAPTGESIRFLGMPTALEWYMRKIFKMERQIVNLARPVAKAIYSVNLPGSEYFDEIQSLYEKLQGVDKILSNPEITTVRIIMNPEKIVIKEAQRAYMYFCLYGLCVDGIIINKIIPEELSGDYWGEWAKIQKKYIKMIKEIFSPLPLFHIPLFSKEVVGKEDIMRLSDALYGENDPLKIYYSEKVYKFAKENGRYCLKLTLPFAGISDVDLYKKKDELIIRTSGFKQHILLPKHIASFEPSEAVFRENNLNVYFGEKNVSKKRKQKN